MLIKKNYLTEKLFIFLLRVKPDASCRCPIKRHSHHVADTVSGEGNRSDWILRNRLLSLIGRKKVISTDVLAFAQILFAYLSYTHR